ncbi:unnamed protein product, partial [Mesorhabditis belari]|uniref:Kinesin-like protein n=1 Tax=Mesorhabditis belari TaxID=2138241 RepID=A0AAF3FCF9_9BILA
MENIEVACRVKPSSSAVEQKWTLNMEEKNLTTDNGITVQFDHVYDAASKTEQLMANLKQKVDRVIEGYNLCIAAYGRSGSGKTHTICGTDASPGLMQMIVKYIIQKLTDQTQRTYLISAMLFEVYNEHVYDLLASKSDNEFKLQEGGQGCVSLKGAVSHQITALEGLDAVLRIGMTQRRTGVTNFNERSSRSHLVLHLAIEGARPDGDTLLSHIQLVDLAGSEGADASNVATRREEGRNINRSLISFVRVVNSLGSGKHVPYRESKLTRLLQQSLTNAQVTLICTVDLKDDEATTSTLNFAKSAKCIKVQLHKTKLEGVGEIQRLQNLLREREQELTALKIQKASVASQEEHKQKIEEIKKFFLTGSTNEKVVRKVDRRASWAGNWQTLDKRTCPFEDPILDQQPKRLNVLDEMETENPEEEKEIPERAEPMDNFKFQQADVASQCTLEIESVEEIRQKMVQALREEQPIEPIDSSPSNDTNAISELRKDLALADEKIQGRESVIAHLEEEKKSLLSRIERLQAKLLNKENFEEQLKSRLQDVRGQHFEQSQRLEKSTAEQKSLRDKVCLQEKEIAAMNEETKRLQQQFTACSHEMSELKHALEKSEREKNAWLRELQATDVKHQAEMNDYIKKYQEVSKQLDQGSSSKNMDAISNKENKKWVHDNKEYESPEQLLQRLDVLEKEKISGTQMYRKLKADFAAARKQLEVMAETAINSDDTKKWIVNMKEYSSCEELVERIKDLEKQKELGIHKYDQLKERLQQLEKPIKEVSYSQEMKSPTKKRSTFKLLTSCFPYVGKKSTMTMGTPYRPEKPRRKENGVEVADQTEIPRGTPILASIKRTPSHSMITELDFDEKIEAPRYERKRSMSLVEGIAEMELSRAGITPNLGKQTLKTGEKRPTLVPPNTPISPINTNRASYHSALSGRGYPRGYSTPRAGSAIHLVKKLDESSICLAPGEHPNFDLSELSPNTFETLNFSASIDRAAQRVLEKDKENRDDDEEPTPTIKQFPSHVHFRNHF